MDHDQRFKALIRLKFAEFMRLFFERWASHFNYSKIEWMENEAFPDPPEGSRHVMDLVAKLTVAQPIEGLHDENEKEWIVLVLIEIDSSDRGARLRAKIPYYYFMLRLKHQQPVLPIALFLKFGMNGIGMDFYEENIWDLRALRFEYLYVGLPALPALEYLEGESYLGVALSALMKIPEEEVLRLGAEALRKIQESPLPEQEKFLLSECVEAYLPLKEGQKEEFEALLQTEPYRGVIPVNLTSYDKGLLKGREEGRQQAVLAILKNYLEFKFESEGRRFFEQLPENLDAGKLDVILNAAYTETKIDNLRKLLP